MHMTLPLTDERKQALLGPLGLRHSADGVRLEARPDQLDALLRAARVHCLSKVAGGASERGVDLQARARS